jgi:metallo-beta-lactamase family protein
MLSNRLHALPGSNDNVQIVVDGMAQEATDLYQTHTTDREYFSDSIVNRIETGTENVLQPKNVHYPQSDKDRRQILKRYSPATGENIPIVISPSGMLTGGNSPRYLTEFVSRYEEAKIILTGYQANETGGRAIQNAIKADEGEVSLEFDTNPFDTDWNSSDQVVWRTTNRGNQVVRVKLPTSWVTTVEGLSAHGAQQTLLNFARDVQPETITLVHGPTYSQEGLAQHLLNNVETATQVARARLLTPIEITHNPDLNTAALREELIDNPSHQDFETKLETINESVAMLNEVIAEVKQNAITDKDQIKAIVKNEIEEHDSEA